MRVLAIYVVQIKNQPTSTRIVISASDLQHVNWFQRSSVAQVMTFTAKTVAGMLAFLV